MKYTVVLALGILIGYLIGRDHHTVTSAPEPLAAMEAVESSPKHDAPVRKIAARFEKTATKINAEIAATAIQNREEIPFHGRTMTLTNQTIENMEQNWSDLREQIHLSREQDGWRIINLKSGSIFADAGFIEGDLITNKAVESLANQDAGGGDLPRRFSRVLDYVTN